MRRIFESPLGLSSAASLGCGFFFGFFGRKRTSFSSDHSYNKYHLAVLSNLLTSFGLNICASTPNPALPALLFGAAFSIHCVPVYIAGVREMQDKYFPYHTWLTSLLGIYLLVAGFGVLFYRGSLI